MESPHGVAIWHVRRAQHATGLQILAAGHSESLKERHSHERQQDAGKHDRTERAEHACGALGNEILRPRIDIAAHHALAVDQPQDNDKQNRQEHAIGHLREHHQRGKRQTWNERHGCPITNMPVKRPLKMSLGKGVRDAALAAK